jgi:APA family basic amino acid/polyamine antiporter
VSARAAAAVERRLGVFDATMIIVGSMIGSGVFLGQVNMARFIQTPGIFLALWIVGGLLTLAGALSYGELAAAMPHAGGQYVYLREAFGRRAGPLLGFLYGWALFFVIQTGFNAAVSIAFAKFLGVFVPGVGEAHRAVGPFSTAQLVAVGCIAALTWVNSRGVVAGARVQNVFTVGKVGALAALVAVGFAAGKGSFANFTPLLEPRLGAAAVGMGLAGALAAAMSKALFAYDAWNTVTFTAGEIRAPERNLPRALIWGTLLTTVIYVGAAAVYTYNVALPDMPDPSVVPEGRIASAVAQKALGPFGASLVAAAVLISTFGCVNGLILGGARVFYAMAKDGLFYRRAGELAPNGAPVVALVLQGIWSAVLALSGTFDALLTYTTFVSLLFNTLTVVGLFALRRAAPDAPRPYRVWGYPVVPGIYCVVAAVFALYIGIGLPRESLAGLGLVLTGLPAYGWLRRRRRPTS